MLTAAVVSRGGLWSVTVTVPRSTTVFSVLTSSYTGNPNPAFAGAIGVPAEAAYWHARADELADWALAHMVNRGDVWGGYYRAQDATGVWTTCQTTHPRRADRGKLLLTREVLVSHFSATCTGDVIGLHTTSPENTSRWGALDIDRHGDGGPAPDVTLAAALHWHDRLRDRGFEPLLTASNGRGGYHLRVLFREPVPTPRLFSFLRHLVRDHVGLGLGVAPEVFPKQPGPVRYGNWLRLVGRHHTRPFWSAVWDADECRWQRANQAIDLLVSHAGDDPAHLPKAPAPRRAGRAPPREAPAVPAGGACPALIELRIRAYLTKLPRGLAEGQGRDDYGFRLAALLVRDLALSEGAALPWMRQWDARNGVPKGEAALARLLADARLYGQNPVGSGLSKLPDPGRRLAPVPTAPAAIPEVVSFDD
jgi:hypothetical protein